MPVTAQISDVQIGLDPAKGERSVSSLLKGTCPKQWNRSKQIIQSSFNDELLASNCINSSNNGLVYAIVEAYSRHKHLTLRPDDIWFAILSQLNFYINAHAEELRSFFVAHEGQKELEVVEVGTLATVDVGLLAIRMTAEIEKNVVDPELRRWIMPEFSTTTTSDRVVAAVLMMGALQKYFSFRMTMSCGLPSVTLLGERSDWQVLVQKLEKIPQLGQEPAHFAQLLKPVLERFVRTFDAPQDPAVIDFWNKCAHKKSGSGSCLLSGWVTAFCYWGENGKSLLPAVMAPEVSFEAFKREKAGCELDGVFFHRLETRHIPAGFAHVPVKVNDNGAIYETRMLAGLMGLQATNREQGTEYVGMDTSTDSLQPVSGWWMYEVEGQAEADRRKKEIAELQEEMSRDVYRNSAWDSPEKEKWMEMLRRREALESF